MNTCHGCRFWSIPPERREYAERDEGSCKHGAPILRPIVTMDSYKHQEAAWPRVRGDDWCGQWEALS